MQLYVCMYTYVSSFTFSVYLCHCTLLLENWISSVKLRHLKSVEMIKQTSGISVLSEEPIWDSGQSSWAQAEDVQPTAEHVPLVEEVAVMNLPSGAQHGLLSRPRCILRLNT